MRRVYKYYLGVCIAAILFLCSIGTLTVAAATTEQDGIRANLHTSQERYEKGQEIKAVLEVTNTRNEDIEIDIATQIPEGYVVSGEIGEGKENLVIKSGESISLDVTYKKNTDKEEVGEETNQEEVNQDEIEKEEVDEEVNTEENQEEIDKEEVVVKEEIKKEEVTQVAAVLDKDAVKKEEVRQDTVKKEEGSQVVAADSVDTADHNDVVLYVVISVLAMGGVVVVCKKRKHLKNHMMSIVLVGVMIGGLLYPITSKANEVEGDTTFKVQETVLVGGSEDAAEEVKLEMLITYRVDEVEEDTDIEEDIDEEDNTVVTREEWIVNLMQLFQDDLVEAEYYTFDDFAQVKSPEVIESAIRYGYVTLEPDNDNMVYFHPDEPATREFVAYSLAQVLQYQVDENAVLECTDSNEITYHTQAWSAVNIGALKLIDKAFRPNDAYTVGMMNRTNYVVQDILASTNVSSETVADVDYAEDVAVEECHFFLDSENHTVYLDEGVADKWKEGEIHVLKNLEDSTQDVAIKITKVVAQEGGGIVTYEEPELWEVVESIEIEGTQSEGGTFTPSEGVTLVSDTPGPEAPMRARGAISGTVPLSETISLTVKLDGVTTEIKLEFDKLEYRFAAKPTWSGLGIEEVYMVDHMSCEVGLSHEFEEEKDDDKKKECKQKLGDFNCPLGYGFNGSGEVYLIVEANGSFGISVETTYKGGIQYTKQNGLRPIKGIEHDTDIAKLEAEFKAGALVEVGIEFLGIDLAMTGVEAGRAAKGSLKLIPPNQFCLDAKVYPYLTLFAKIGPDELQLKYEKKLIDEDSLTSVQLFHFEETGFVKKCTHGEGKCAGHVRNASTGEPIPDAKIQILKEGEVKDTAFTNDRGEFTGHLLSTDNYQMNVSAAGYTPYQIEIYILNGETTTVETQLMISRADEAAAGDTVVMGTGQVVDAYTGMNLIDATIHVYSQDLFGTQEEVATTTSGSMGEFSFQAVTGNYRLEITKEGYATVTKSITLIQNCDGIHIAMSPKNQDMEASNLRMVLHWGEQPYDLDSHMVGPEDGGRFHIFFANRNCNYGDLDVDDTDSYGPETISISEIEEGIYSYYVHDFTNCSMDNSSALSNSGVYIELYSNNVLVNKIYAPTNREGTLWHVFDYDDSTKKFTLVNEFSYEQDAGNVGGVYNPMARSSVCMPNKISKEKNAQEEPVQEGVVEEELVEEAVQEEVVEEELVEEAVQEEVVEEELVEEPEQEEVVEELVEETVEIRAA